MAEDTKTAYAKAVQLLARRDHAITELRQKLLRRGFTSESVEWVITELSQEGVLDDCRFAAHYLRQRAMKGYGPVRLRGELQQLEITEETIERALAELELDWGEAIARVHRKKYHGLPQDFAERVKQSKFLEYRGFQAEHIRALFSTCQMTD